MPSSAQARKRWVAGSVAVTLISLLVTAFTNEILFLGQKIGAKNCSSVAGIQICPRWGYLFLDVGSPQAYVLVRGISWAPEQAMLGFPGTRAELEKMMGMVATAPGKQVLHVKKNCGVFSENETDLTVIAVGQGMVYTSLPGAGVGLGLDESVRLCSALSMD